VRVHTDAASVALADSMHARALHRRQSHLTSARGSTDRILRADRRCWLMRQCTSRSSQEQHAPHPVSSVIRSSEKPRLSRRA
jgi:hypothetical protein